MDERSLGGIYDTARAEMANGYYEAEMLRGSTCEGPWKTIEDLGQATLGWVRWGNHERLYGYLDEISEADSEDNLLHPYRHAQSAGWNQIKKCLHQIHYDSNHSADDVCDQT